MTTLSLARGLHQGIDRNAVEKERAVQAERQRMAEQRLKFRDWSMRVPEPKGRLDLDRFPFQREWYSEDYARDVEGVLSKAAQIGASAHMVRWALFWTDMLSAVTLYVFPTYTLMRRFSYGRVRRSIRASDYLRERVAPESIDNVEQREVGGGTMYMTGSESETALEAVDADVLVLDEFDRLSNVSLAEYRISGSQIGLMRRIGIPSIPNFGISKLLADTDRRRWLVKCPAGHELPMRWPDSVDIDRKVRVCAECRAVLRPQEVAAGRWVAENPDADIRGYHAPRLIVPQLDLGPMIVRSQKTLPEARKAFWNRDMAEPYAPEEGRLSEQAIASAVSFGEKAGATARAGGYVGNNLVTAGIDVHSDQAQYVRVSEHLDDGRRRALFIGAVPNYNELAKIIDAYNVNVACIDHMPEKLSSRALAERFPGRVLLVAYANPTQGDAINVDEDRRMVSVRRTEAIDATVDAIRFARNLLPPDAPPEYAEQLGNEVREASSDSQGRKVVKWVKVGPSHYLHAEVYDLVAKVVWEHRMQIHSLGVGEIEAMEERLDYERSALHEEDPVLRDEPLREEW